MELATYDSNRKPSACHTETYNIELLFHNPQYLEKNHVKYEVIIFSQEPRICLPLFSDKDSESRTRIGWKDPEVCVCVS